MRIALFPHSGKVSPVLSWRSASTFTRDEGLVTLSDHHYRPLETNMAGALWFKSWLSGVQKWNWPRQLPVFPKPPEAPGDETRREFPRTADEEEADEEEVYISCQFS